MSADKTPDLRGGGRLHDGVLGAARIDHERLRRDDRWQLRDRLENHVHRRGEHDHQGVADCAQRLPLVDRSDLHIGPTALGRESNRRADEARPNDRQALCDIRHWSL